MSVDSREFSFTLIYRFRDIYIYKYTSRKYIYIYGKNRVCVGGKCVHALVPIMALFVN